MCIRDSTKVRQHLHHNTRHKFRASVLQFDRDSNAAVFQANPVERCSSGFAKQPVSKGAHQAGAQSSCACHLIGAVSYTHLDVYKRQAPTSTKRRIATTSSAASAAASTPPRRSRASSSRSARETILAAISGSQRVQAHRHSLSLIHI